LRFFAKQTILLLCALCMIFGSVFIPSALAEQPTLRQGDHDPAVKTLQKALKDKGFFKGDEITDYFGKQTLDAVIAFQKKNDIDPDGVVGAKTWDQLNSKSNALSNTDKLSYGDRNDEVKKAQERLNKLGLLAKENITGYYGNLTEAAVKRFQESLNLKADGVIGAKTKEKLYSSYQAASLVPGMFGNDVKKMQTRLKELGYFKANATGQFGSITQASVISFQRGNKLTADGIAGKQTLARLYSKNAVSEKDARRAGISTSGKLKTAREEKLDTLIAYAKQYMGKPYVYGASGPNSFDCSGYTAFVFKKISISLPHSAKSQGYGKYGTKIDKYANLQVGDLVFFDTLTSSTLCDHVGIYLGGGKFLHAHSRDKVIISNMASGYYRSVFVWGKRLF